MDFQEMCEVYTEISESNDKNKINEFTNKYPNFYQEMQMREKWGLLK